MVPVQVHSCYFQALAYYWTPTCTSCFRIFSLCSLLAMHYSFKSPKSALMGSGIKEGVLSYPVPLSVHSVTFPWPSDAFRSLLTLPNHFRALPCVYDAVTSCSFRTHNFRSHSAHTIIFNIHPIPIHPTPIGFCSLAICSLLFTICVTPYWVIFQSRVYHPFRFPMHSIQPLFLSTCYFRSSILPHHIPPSPFPILSYCIPAPYAPFRSL